MFQTFENSSDPSMGPARLAALRAQMAAHKIDAFFIPALMRIKANMSPPAMHGLLG